jgi:hypothetical protein
VTVPQNCSFPAAKYWEKNMNISLAVIGDGCGEWFVGISVCNVTAWQEV